MPLTHRPFSRSTWYLLVVILVCQFAMVISGILYTDHVATLNAQKWCDLVTTLDNAYQHTPPSTPTGQKLAANIHKLRDDLNCDG